MTDAGGCGRGGAGAACDDVLAAGPGRSGTAFLYRRLNARRAGARRSPPCASGAATGAPPGQWHFVSRQFLPQVLSWVPTQ